MYLLAYVYGKIFAIFSVKNMQFSYTTTEFACISQRVCVCAAERKIAKPEIDFTPVSAISCVGASEFMRLEYRVFVCVYVFVRLCLCMRK